MKNKLDSTTSWTLITIDDAPKFVPGKSVLGLLQLFLSKFEFNFIVLDDIEGSGTTGLIRNLREKLNTVIEINEFLKILPEINQFEWGDFFLFKEYPKNWLNPKQELYSVVIAKSDTTVRAIDGQYLYVYTPHQEMVDLINENYDVESIKTAPLAELDYPG